MSLAVQATGAALICLAAVLFARPLGKLLDIIDEPDEERKIHTKPVPLVGGLGIFGAVSVILASLAFQYEDYRLELLTALAAASIFFFVGLMDDRNHLKPWPRLIILGLTTFIACTVEPMNVLHFINSHDLGFRFGLEGAAIPITIFVVLCFQNAVNMADGTDGLLFSLCLVWLAVLWPWAAAPYSDLIIILAAAIGVALIANWRHLLFSGDSGSYFLAALIGFTAIQLFNVNAGALPADYLGAAFMLPVLDMGRLLVQRVWEGRHPFKPDCEHFHHILLRITASRKITVEFYCLLCASPLLTIAFPALSIYVVIVGQFILYSGCLIYDRRGRLASRESKVSVPKMPS